VEDNLLVKELELLKKENTYLKQLLSNLMHQREETVAISNGEKIISNRSLPKEKINLFKSLFKGRMDVFAYRWESKDGRSPAFDFGNKTGNRTFWPL
jgi:hypothetical protein